MVQIWKEGAVEHKLAWSYSDGGSMLGFTLDDVPYFYQRNMQNDVVAIYNTAGEVVARYSYDVWGKILDIQEFTAYNIGALNPIRYRGYYYDTETDYYYCQSRYYNPEWCRWINADVYMDTDQGVLGTNMYAYCRNNPVNRCDPSGASDVAVLPMYTATFGPVALIEPTLFGEIAFAVGFLGVAVYDAINMFGVDNVVRLYFEIGPQAIADKIISAEDWFNQTFGNGASMPGPNDPKWTDSGFSSFRKLQDYYEEINGKLAKDHVLHHIVEQSQTKITRSNFSSKAVNNLLNVVDVPSGINQKIANYYSSKPGGSVFGNQTVRDWLTRQSFEDQYIFGINVLEKALAGKL